jgi:hypothetical protein
VGQGGKENLKKFEKIRSKALEKKKKRYNGW